MTHAITAPAFARRLSLLAACALAVASAGVLAQDAAKPGATQSVRVEGTRDPSTWVRAESPHVVMWTDTSAVDARRQLEQLERLDSLLRLYLAPVRKADAAVGASQKLVLYYLDGQAGFSRFTAGAPTRAIGMVSSCAAGVLGVAVQLAPSAPQAEAELARSPLEPGQSYLFEAYARHFLYRHTDVRAPAAVIEGMAKYFSALRFSTTQMVVGRTPTGVDRYFAVLDEGYQYELDYADVFARTYAPDHDVEVDPRARVRQLEFASRSWALAHFMLSSEERRARMPAFLDAVHHGQPAAEAFERSYGIKLGELGTTLWRYRLTAKTLTVALPSVDPVAVATRVLSRSAGDFVRTEALRAACPTAPQGQDLLRVASEQAAGMNNSEAARAGVARIQVDWGDAATVALALPTLRQAAARDPDDADAAYWLGRAELRLAEQDRGHLAAARTELARAGGLRPAAPEFALARLQAALLAGSEPDGAAIDATVAAWRGARDNNALARQATLAYAWKGDSISALHLLQVLSNDSRDADAQAWAAAWRTRLAGGVAPDALFAEMRRLGRAGNAVREWTLDQDTVAQEVERRRSLQSVRDRIPVDPASGEAPRLEP